MFQEMSTLTRVSSCCRRFRPGPPCAQWNCWPMADGILKPDVVGEAVVGININILLVYFLELFCRMSSFV